MFRGSGLGRPVEEEGGDVLDFVLGQTHGVAVGIVEDAKTLAGRVGRRDVAWSLRKPEPEKLRELDRSVELDLGETLGYKSDKIVNVPLRIIFSTLAVIRARTVNAQVE